MKKKFESNEINEPNAHNTDKKNSFWKCFELNFDSNWEREREKKDISSTQQRMESTKKWCEKKKKNSSPQTNKYKLYRLTKSNLI